MKHRGKTIALSTVALGLVVLVGAGFVAKDWIREEWWIRKLRTGDGQEKEEAVEKLAEMKAVRAVPLLLEAARGIPVQFDEKLGNSFMESAAIIPLKKSPSVERLQNAILRMGKPAAPHLIRALSDKNPFLVALSAQTLKRIYVPGLKLRKNSLPTSIELQQVTPILRMMGENAAEEKAVRKAATEALKRIQGTQDEENK